jgi:hypothetical protein
MGPLRALLQPRVAADPSRPCSACANARRIGGAEYCGLSAGLYPCAEERAMPLLGALFFNACGRGGRFFVSTRETRGCARRETTIDTPEGAP